MENEKKVKLYPNQKLVVVNKAESNKKKLYCILNLQALDLATNVLQSKAGLKLYLYIAKNQDKYIFALSSDDFMKWAGVKKTAYDTAVRELIDNGYLVKRSQTKHTYDFYESGRAVIKTTNPIAVNIAEQNGFVF